MARTTTPTTKKKKLKKAAGKRFWFVATRKDSGVVQFEAPMKRRRCRGDTATGHRCRRVCSLSYPFCWQHTKSRQHLAVRESKALQAAGVRGQKGLYAHQPGKDPVFRRGESIVRYYGERMHDDDLALRYQYEGAPHGVVMSPYAMELDDEWSVDAALLRGVAAYANSPVGTGLRANARLEVDDMRWPPRALLVASRHIYHGQEILTQYGRHYFKYSALDTKVVARAG